jgi:hypothetical protein
MVPTMITQLMSWLGLAEQPAQHNQHPEAVDRFMGGESIPSISSGAMDIIAEQRRIEQSIRDYVAAQDRHIAYLEQALAERDSQR